jgi:hypothetical protein
MTLADAIGRIRGPARSPAAWLKARIVAASFSVGIGDWLIFGHDPGISWVLFLVAIGIVATALNPIRALACHRLISVAGLMAGLLPLVDDVNWISFFFALSGLALCRAILLSHDRSEWGARLRRLCVALLFPVRWIIADCMRVFRLLKRRRRPKPTALGWHVWVLPVGCCVVFFLLFVDANPLIADVLGRIDLSAVPHAISTGRVFFWLLIVSFVWPFLHLRTARRATRVRTSVPATPLYPPACQALFSAPAILYSLLPFNVMFAVENGLDVSYLWFGMALPQGMTFAEYAHRGAYPLIITAMLAAGFVLVAMRPAGAGVGSRPIRLLVIAWTVQNLVLVLSAIRRLDFYVAAYSLTYLRLAALVWMILVAFGLITIVIRIVWRKTSLWLITVNAIALSAMLYVSCFVDTPALIALYNLSHSREAAGQGVAIDWSYVRQLGPSVIPALDVKRALLTDETSERNLQSTRQALVQQADARDPNWRAWTLESWRLRRYLAKTDGDTQDHSPGRY